MPQVTPITETRHDGGYIVWEPSNGIVTRLEVDLAADAGAAFLEAGMVLGKVTVGGAYVPWNPGAADGSEDVAGILFGGRQLKVGAAVKAVINHQGPMRVNAAELTWGPAADTAPERAAALVALAALPGGGIQAT